MASTKKKAKSPNYGFMLLNPKSLKDTIEPGANGNVWRPKGKPASVIPGPVLSNGHWIMGQPTAQRALRAWEAAVTRVFKYLEYDPERAFRVVHAGDYVKPDYSLEVIERVEGILGMFAVEHDDEHGIWMPSDEVYVQADWTRSISMFDLTDSSKANRGLGSIGFPRAMSKDRPKGMKVAEWRKISYGFFAAGYVMMFKLLGIDLWLPRDLGEWGVHDLEPEVSLLTEDVNGLPSVIGGLMGQSIPYSTCTTSDQLNIVELGEGVC